jgi:molybdenum cofactor cytidylyltransferase
MKTIIGVFLAAGQSTRMGRNKLALPLAGTTVGSLTLYAAIQSELDHIIVVENGSKPHCAWADMNLLSNHDKWSIKRCNAVNNGQSDSIACGVEKAEKLGADAIVIMLADQPFLSVSLINQLLSVYENLEKPLSYVALALNQDIRPPILFSKECFPVLKKLRGDEGAKKLIKAGSLGEGRVIDGGEPLNFFDIDTPQDYKEAKGEWPGEKSSRCHQGFYSKNN